jgi:hypothetical protein
VETLPSSAGAEDQGPPALAIDHGFGNRPSRAFLPAQRDHFPDRLLLPLMRDEIAELEGLVEGTDTILFSEPIAAN